MELRRTAGELLELAVFVRQLGWRLQLWLSLQRELVSLPPAGLLFWRFQRLVQQLASGVPPISWRLVYGTLLVSKLQPVSRLQLASRLLPASELRYELLRLPLLADVLRFKPRPAPAFSSAPSMLDSSAHAEQPLQVSVRSRNLRTIGQSWHNLHRNHFVELNFDSKGHRVVS